MRTSMLAGSVVLFAAFAVIGFLLCLQLGIRGWRQVPAIIGFGASAAIVAMRFGLGFAHASAATFARFIAPSGSTTPYEYGYSYVGVRARDALGRLKGASPGVER